MQVIKAVFEELPNLVDLQDFSNISEVKLMDDNSTQQPEQAAKESEDENKKVILKLMDKSENEYFSIKIRFK